MRPSAPHRDCPHCDMLTASLSASRTKGQRLAGKAKASSCGLLGTGHAGEGRRRACGPDARACRTRSRVQGLTSAVVWKAFWCWLQNGRGRGTPAQAGGEVTGQVGVQAGQTGHGDSAVGQRRCFAGSGMAAGGAAAARPGMCEL